MRPDWSGPSHLDAGRTGTSLVGHDDWKAKEDPLGRRCYFCSLADISCSENVSVCMILFLLKTQLLLCRMIVFCPSTRAIMLSTSSWHAVSFETIIVSVNIVPDIVRKGTLLFKTTFCMVFLRMIDLLFCWLVYVLNCRSSITITKK